MTLTARQVEFADAALRLVVRDGIDAVSFRNVAAEAGWSLGAVQKAYRSKDEMVSAMFERLREGFIHTSDTPEAEPSMPEWFVGYALYILPFTEQRRELHLQEQGFRRLAPYDPGVARALASADEVIRTGNAERVRRGQAAGEIGAEVDPDSFAWALLLLIQGAAMQLLYDPDVDHDTVRASMRRSILALLGRP